MASISGGMKYDFKAARQRIVELTMMYRQGRRMNEHDPEWGWDLVAQIEEIEREIAEAHRSRNGKMTTVSGSGHPIVHLNNVVTPIISAWDGDGKVAQ